MAAKLSEVKTELMQRRHLPIPEQGRRLASVIRGHCNYYAVPGNSDAMIQFRTQAARHWCRALRRRSQRHRLDWERMNRLANRWLPPARMVHPYPEVRFTPEPEGGAQCASSARWDLCGGRAEPSTSAKVRPYRDHIPALQRPVAPVTPEERERALGVTGGKATNRASRRDIA